MIILSATTDKLQLVTDAAAAVDVHWSYADLDTATGAVTPGRQNAAVTTAATTDVLAAPASGVVRNAKTMHCRNKDATVTVGVTVVYNQNATLFELHEAVLAPGESLEYLEGVGFFVLAATSARRYLTTAEQSFGQNILASALSRAALSTLVTVTNTGYAVYVGRVVADITVAYVELYVTVAGAGAQTAEVGLFSTPSAPNKSTQTLTKIVATGTVDSLTATGAKRNTAAFNQTVAAGTHLWAAARTAMATTQPTCAGLAGDMSEAHVLTMTTPGALTGLTTITGVIPGIVTAAVAPDLRVTLV